MYYEFKFEDGSTYYGTCADKNEFCKHLTKREREELGRIVSKSPVSENFVKNWRDRAMAALCL